MIYMPIPQNFSSPIRMSAKERALSQIQSWIIDGTLQPGEKLLDAELAEALGVSRTPIREAFQLLEVQGFVSMHPGKETRVTSLDKEDILKIYPTLASLYSLAAEYAAKVILPEQIEMLKEINLQFSKAVETEQPFQAMELDEQFHNFIIEVSENPYIASFSSSLQMHIGRFSYVFLKQPPAATLASVKGHDSIILYLQNHDAEKASMIMKQHILKAMQELYALL